MYSKYLILFVFFISSVPLLSQTPPAYISDSLQGILDSSLPSTISNSGAVMGVHVPGQWSWYGSSGHAISGMTSGQPASIAHVDSKFRVGSLTKTMVATCILFLEEDGLLDIEDPIVNYLRSTLIDDTIQSSGTVRVRHLLNHTSGISNSADNTTCQQDVLINPAGAHSLEEAVYCGASLGEIFPPEFAWAYSNTNYSLLAMIIETVTGQSYKSYLTQKIITPLGLLNTEVPSTNQIAGDHMGCYWNIGSWVDLTIINPTTYTGWADVVSTTEDLNAFFKALLEGDLVNAASLAKMAVIDPASYDYGLGIDFYQVGGVPYYGHYGEVANSSAMIYCELSSSIAPDGYFISYNFNVQGVDMPNLVDVPVFDLLNSSPLNVNEQVAKSTFTFYPNPVDDVVTIALNNSDRAAIKLMDITGNVVGEFTTNTSVYSTSLSGLASGSYLLQIETDGAKEVKNIILR
ncbi:MAG: serine hydrolase [Crocinitomicaceae bacterium]|nr:serine hydrolase [Crocinitomicaceae bacterium]